MTEKQSVSRRGFLETTGAVAGATLASGAFAHPAIGGGVKGANEKLNFAAIGSGGPLALAAAHALIRHTDFPASKIATESMEIAGQLCIYTNNHVTIEEL